MQLLQHLQFSVNAVFEFYKTFGKRLYGFSALFAIVSSLFTIIFGSVIVLIYSGIVNTFNLYPSSEISSNYSEFYLFNITIVTTFLTTINLSFYAIFLNRFTTTNRFSLSFGSFMGTIKPGDWLNYFGFSIGGALVYLAAQQILAFSSGMSNSAGPLSHLVGAPNISRLITGFFQVLLDYLPGILGVLVVYFHLKRTSVRILTARQLISVTLTVFIIGTVLFITTSKFIAFVQYFVGGIISIPFVEPLIPSLILILIYLFLLSAFYPALASCFLTPFLYFKEEQTTEKPLTDSNLLDE